MTNYAAFLPRWKKNKIRRTGVREAGVFRHHGITMKGPPETLANIGALYRNEGFKGER